MDYAYKMDIIHNNPADKVQRPKKEQYIGSFYNENELNELFEKSKDDPMHLIILVTAYYGLRRSEVLGLKWDAFDFENKTVTIKHTVIIAKSDGKRQLIKKDRTKNLIHIRFHDLRHSCASLLLAKGIPMKAIQEWLGHSNFSTTANIYAHLDSNSKQFSADTISSAFNLNNVQKIEMKNANLHLYLTVSNTNG